MLRSLVLALALHLVAWAAPSPAAVPVPDPDANAPAASPAQDRQAKQLPPSGIPLSEVDRVELTRGVSELGNEIGDLRRGLAPGRRLDLLPDIEVFHKAVDWALRFDEFHDLKEVGLARELLLEGRARAAALKEGRSPWTEATGPVVRGFRSVIDGSVQPYGVVVPEAWKGRTDERPRATWIWNHGRGDTLSELAFIAQRRKGTGEFAPTNTFVVHPYGRYCNATKFAGEQDVFEALAAMRRSYPMDQYRLVNAGFSMGGASAWHLGVHHAEMWAVTHPGAGFAETAEYAGVFSPGKPRPAWWEQVLWRWYDATVAVANFRSHPVLAYHGSEDKQGQATAIMKRFADREGVVLEHFVGPGVGHKYEAETKKRIAARVDEILSSRVRPPREVHWVTYSLIYPKCGWITITGMDRQWERAEVDGRIQGPPAANAPRLEVRTRGVSRLRLDPPRPGGTSAALARYGVMIDGEELAPAERWPTVYAKAAGKWRLEEAGDRPAGVLRKEPGLCGPVDHAFLSAFLFVAPTGEPGNPTVGAWTRRELEHAVRQWRGIFRGEAPVKSDASITEADIASNHLVLWGDPASNAVLRRIAGKLPVRWTAEGIEFGGRMYSARHVPILIFPNPLNPTKYVVLNSGFTFCRASASGTNSRQTPRLPDWAIIDASSPPDDTYPGRVADAGFFDEAWKFTTVRPE